MYAFMHAQANENVQWFYSKSEDLMCACRLLEINKGKTLRTTVEINVDSAN